MFGSAALLYVLSLDNVISRIDGIILLGIFIYYALFLFGRIKHLEDMLFALGAMEEAPCFCCGYNGAGYYQPETHACAKRHHRLRANVEFSGAQRSGASAGTQG